MAVVDAVEEECGEERPTVYVERVAILGEQLRASTPRRRVIPPHWDRVLTPIGK